MSGTESLRGRRILVAEDEYLIAHEIVAALEAAGAEVVGPFPRLAEVREALDDGEFGGAILDVNLGGEWIWPVAELLTARQVPVVLATGYDARIIPRAHAHLTRCEKPLDPRTIAAALARRIAAGRAAD